MYINEKIGRETLTRNERIQKPFCENGISKVRLSENKINVNADTRVCNGFLGKTFGKNRSICYLLSP